MKRLLTFFLFAVLAFAEQRASKIIPVKNVDANRLANKIGELTLANISGPSGLRMTTVQNNIVLSGPDDAVAAAEQLIKALDVAEPKLRTIEVAGYIVLGMQQAGDGGAMPADLDPVLKQFRSLLSYKNFRVLDTIILRGKENSYMSSDGFLALPGSAGATADFTVQHPGVTDDIVHLKNLALTVHIPTTRVNDKGHVITTDVRIATDADVKAGQKVAIGKASVDSAGDALILVISAKVVD